MTSTSTENLPDPVPPARPYASEIAQDAPAAPALPVTLPPVPAEPSGAVEPVKMGVMATWLALESVVVGDPDSISLFALTRHAAVRTGDRALFDRWCDRLAAAARTTAITDDLGTHHTAATTRHGWNVTVHLLTFGQEDPR